MAKFQGKITAGIVRIFFICWLPFALALSAINIRCAIQTYRLFHGKSDSERMRLVTGDRFSTIKICLDNTPLDSKILIIDFPYDSFGLEYYLHPRLINMEDSVRDIINYCRAEKIGYYLIYDDNKQPVLKRVK
jgi:hypothetical protein